MQLILKGSQKRFFKSCRLTLELSVLDSEDRDSSLNVITIMQLLACVDHLQSEEHAGIVEQKETNFAGYCTLLS